MVFTGPAWKEAEEVAERIALVRGGGPEVKLNPEDVLFDRQWGALMDSMPREEFVARIASDILQVVAAEEVRHSFNIIADGGSRHGFYSYEVHDEWAANLAAIAYGGSPYYALGRIIRDVRNTEKDIESDGYSQGVHRALGSVLLGAGFKSKSGDALKVARKYFRKTGAKRVDAARQLAAIPE
jgi:hypothetical protein